MNIEEVNVREEEPRDYEKVFSLTFTSFRHNNFSDGSEAEIIRKLRNSPFHIPGLSIVAEYHDEIIGHVIFSKNRVRDKEIVHESLTLGPMSVLPTYQQSGIGKKLLKYGLERAASLGFKSVIVLGHAGYYPKFGFKPASLFNIKCPFTVPDEVFMALELEPGSLNNISGTVEYPPEFFAE